MYGVDNMRTPVTQGSHTKIVPAAPLAVVKIFVIVVVTLRQQPYIPIQRLWNRFCRGEFSDGGIPPVPASRVVHMRGNSRHIFYNACLFPSFKLEVISL